MSAFRNPERYESERTIVDLAKCVNTITGFSLTETGGVTESGGVIFHISDTW